MRATLRRSITGLVVLALASAWIAACSGGAASRVAGPADGSVGAPTTLDLSAQGGPMAAPTAAPAPAGEATSGGGYAGSGSSGAAFDTGPAIVRTGSLAMEVAALDPAILRARALIVGLGGYQSDSQRSNSGDQPTATITYRIPAARWDDALDGLHGLATKVLTEDTRSQEVTGQVIDLGARIDNLRATERALQAIMTRATRVSDILEVQNQLSAVQGEIEQLSSQKAHLEDQAAMGTLAVNYVVPVVAVTQATTGWNLGAEVDRAVAQLVQLGQGLAVAAVWLAIVGLPLLVGGLVLAGLLVLILRLTGLRERGRPEVPALPEVASTQG
jgi:hypothetical protein